MAKFTALFESETCTRCGGSGQYSYCQTYGTRCFKCGGTGVQLTKRGHVAQAFYISLLSVPARELKVGDWYRDTVDGKNRKITAIKAPVHPNQPGELILDSADFGWYVGPDTLVRRVLPQAEREVLIAQARAFQDTLTKAGKPRAARSRK